MDLRDYQVEAIEAIQQSWQAHRSIVVVLPTGVGKTAIATALLNSGGRWLFIAHRDEIVQQIAEAMARQMRPARRERFGYSYRDIAAGTPRDCGIAMYTGRTLSISPGHAVATVQWLAANLERFFRSSGYTHLVIDEAHHAVAPIYRRVIEAFLQSAPDGRILGLTATARRADGIPLASVFEEIAFHRNIKWFVDRGYLVPAEAYRVECDIDLSRTRTSAYTGDFLIDHEFIAAMNASNWLQVVPDTWMDLARDRKTIAFCASIEHSKQLVEALRSRGIHAEHLDGYTPTDERRRLLDAYHAGEIRVLSNVAVLTEGFDDPTTECVVMARPTKSQLFYIQCIGRALRTAEGKSSALVLDFGANDHSLVQLADLDPDHDLRRIRGELHGTGWYGTAFYDDVLLSLAQRRAILYFTAANAYTRAMELLRHPRLAWACFDDCALLDVSDKTLLFVLSPARAAQVHGAMRLRLRPYAEAGLYTVLSIANEPRIVGTGTADDIVEIASDYAEALATKLADGRARWRMAPASSRQIGILRQRYGVDPMRLSGLNRGEVSSIISYMRACEALGIQP